MRFAATEDGDDDEHPRELVARDAPVPIKNIFFFPPWGRRRRRRRFLSRRPVVETVLRIIDCGIESRRTKKRGGEFLFVFERNSMGIKWETNSEKISPLYKSLTSS